MCRELPSDRATQEVHEYCCPPGTTPDLSPGSRAANLSCSSSQGTSLSFTLSHACS